MNTNKELQVETQRLTSRVFHSAKRIHIHIHFKLNQFRITVEGNRGKEREVEILKIVFNVRNIQLFTLT